MLLCYINLKIFQYERRYQISNGPFSSVFCVKQRGKRYHTHYAAKYLRANTERAKREVRREEGVKVIDIILLLGGCPPQTTELSPGHQVY